MVDVASSDPLELAQLQRAVPPQLASFASHDWASNTDLSPGAYTANGGQLNYDSLSMALNDSYVDPKLSFIAINHQVSGTLGTTQVVNTPLTICPKSGLPFLYNAQVSLDNKLVNQGSPYLNLSANYTMLSSWSTDKQKALGPVYFFSPDNVTSATVIQQNNSGAGNNQWVCLDNNQWEPYLNIDASNAGIAPVVSSNMFDNCTVRISGIGAAAPGAAPHQYYPMTWNEGAYERSVWTAGPAGFLNYTATQTGIGNNIYFDLAANTTGVIVSFWVLYPLPLICDVFEKCGLLKSRIQINLNLNGVFSCTKTAGNAVNVGYNSSLIPNLTGTSNICPIMVSSQILNRPSTGGATQTNGYQTLSTSIGGTTFLYLHIVRLKPEQKITEIADRYIEYYDYQVFNYTNLNQPALNWNITSGVQKARKVVIWKFANPGSIDPTGNGAVSGGTIKGIAPQLSLASSEPGHSTPGIYLGTNLQIYVGSKPLYQYPIQYTWLSYFQEKVMQYYQSGTDPLLIQGMQNMQAFQSAGVESWDLLKGQLSEADVNNTQIQIVGTVTVPVPGMSVDLVCLLFYQRAIRIDRDGHVTLIY